MIRPRFVRRDARLSAIWFWLTVGNVAYCLIFGRLLEAFFDCCYWQASAILTIAGIEYFEGMPP